MTKRATAEDVARAAGVSRATVSRAFTPSAYVAKATREKIENAAESLGYRRNALARALIKNESDLVAVVTGKMNNLFDAEVFDQLSAQLQENRRWGLLVHADDEDVGRLLNEALSYPVQAVIVRSGSVNAETIQQCRKLGVPIILTGMENADFDADSVCCDNAAGARMAVNTLIERGCSRISYLGGPAHLYSETSRHDSFSRTMRESGLESHSTHTGDFTFESGLEFGKQILSEPSRPDGIFCCNDAMAIGALNAARNHFGFSVPDDVAIVGFDDIPMADWPCFQLTTIRNAVEPTIAATIRILEHRLSNPDAPPQVTRIEPQLIRRQTA